MVLVFIMLRRFLWFILVLTISLCFMWCYTKSMLWLLPKLHTLLAPLGRWWAVLILILGSGLLFNPLTYLVEAIGFNLVGGLMYLCSWIYPSVTPSYLLLRLAIYLTVIPVALVLLFEITDDITLLSVILYLAALTVYTSACHYTYIGSISGRIFYSLGNGRFIKESNA